MTTTNISLYIVALPILPAVSLIATTSAFMMRGRFTDIQKILLVTVAFIVSLLTSGYLISYIDVGSVFVQSSLFAASMMLSVTTTIIVLVSMYYLIAHVVGEKMQSKRT